MKKISDYTAFEGVPETFNIFEKDGVCAWSCSRCDETGVLGDVNIEFAKKFGNDFHSACPIKADLEETDG